MPQYNWLTFGAAKTNLSQRLADPAFQFWTDIECGLCLIEALRAWNAYTEIWNADFTFTASSASHWYDLATLSGSPRLRTVSDSDLYTMMQYHLLEPPTGAGAWTGTSQFSLADLQGALQRRRDEMIQVSGCNLAHLAPLNITPGTYTITLADNVLEPHRARFLPDVGNPVTLKREDRGAWNAFNPGRLQHPDVPAAWSILSGPPLSLDTDVPVSLPGQVDLIVLQSGNVFAPPAATLLNVPDDWAWAPQSAG